MMTQQPTRGASEPARAAVQPLSTLLSQALVAFTIGCDNEFERQMPHRTTSHNSTATSPRGPWLTSLAMWSNCLQFVNEDGVTVRDLERLARTHTNLDGMRRWGYIVIEDAPVDGKRKRPRSDWVIRPTRAGRKAQEVWRPLPGAIEERWQARFGKDEVEQLRKSLSMVVNQMDSAMPDCLPILGYGLFSRWRPPDGDHHPGTQASSHLPLSALLSRVVLSFAIEFERESEFSLAISANLLRVIDEKGVRVRDLPLVTGVSKEAISMGLGVLQKSANQDSVRNSGGHAGPVLREFLQTSAAVIEPDPAANRTKLVRLTPAGKQSRDAYRQLVVVIEERWNSRFGMDAIRALRKELEKLVGEGTVDRSPLFAGLEPYPDSWRASVRRPEVLPHFPMVLHRGGYPDGS